MPTDLLAREQEIVIQAARHALTRTIEQLYMGGAGSVYGPVAFITSATSPTLTDWPGGGIVGVHGTNTPGLIPGRISHGCVRLRNADIL